MIPIGWGLIWGIYYQNIGLMTALQQLSRQALRKKKKQYPNVPEYGISKPIYKDKTSNGLTKCIIDYLRLEGQQAERISVTGRQINNTRSVKDVLGRVRTIGSSKWIKSSMQKGSADISATIYGRSVKIEVKIGADRQRPEQTQYQNQILKSGGLYYIAKDFESFYKWYKENFKQSNK